MATRHRPAGFSIRLRWFSLAVLALHAVPARAAGQTTEVFESEHEPAASGRIDELAAARWRQLGIQPARLSSDSVFLRRVYLDTTGTLPAAKDAAAFLQSSDPGKRSKLIDRLLESEDFAAYQAMKWDDALRVKAEFPINLWPNAAQAYHHWILASIRDNLTYDRFARELLTASGSNFRDPAVNFYRAMQNRTPAGIAQSVALTFMGTRTGDWAPERLAQMAEFFSRVGYKKTGEWKEEILYSDPAKTGPAKLTFPDGTTANVDPSADPRAVFAGWLIRPSNPWFARAAVNRIWCRLFGRGIIHEPDDIRPDNAPENPELLAWLEKEFAASHFDLRSLYRLILNSDVYQLSPIPRSDPALATAHFAVYPLMRLDAEVLVDALCRITGTSETYTSAVPEPYTFMPDFQSAVSLPDGSIGSAVLDLFGRPSRDTGFEAERNNRLTGAQRLYLLNSSQVQRKIQQGPNLLALMRETKDPQELVSRIYLTILSRYPTPDERNRIAKHAQTRAIRGPAAVFDLAWALINSTEFLYRH